MTWRRCCEAFRAQDAAGDQPCCFIAYTIKGMGLPFAGHKDNHSGLMSKEQMAGFKQEMGIRDGEEWEPLAGLDIAGGRGAGASSTACPSPPRSPPRAAGWKAPRCRCRRTSRSRRCRPAASFPPRRPSARCLPNSGAGRGPRRRSPSRIVTTSPDVTVSTNLGAWVNRRGVFDRHLKNDVFRDAKLASAQRWGMSPEGQHIELGIAEQNLFLLLSAPRAVAFAVWRAAAAGGDGYDPFVNRGLDALIYACYQDARFMLVSTPSGLTLAPEGGQHQSVNTPLIGIAQDRLASYEPTYADELSILMRWAFEHMQKPDGSAVWLRLSTRGLAQPRAQAGPGGRGGGRPLDGAAGAGRAHRHRLPGADRARGDRRLRGAARPRYQRPGCWPSPARTGCMPAGWRRSARPAAAMAHQAGWRNCWRRSTATRHW